MKAQKDKIILFETLHNILEYSYFWYEKKKSKATLKNSRILKSKVAVAK